MKRISKYLTLLYMLLAALTLVVIVLFETDILESGIMAEEKQSEFILTALMELVGYTLLEHAETPGLGAKADKWFQKGEKGDIIGKSPAEPLTVSKDGGKVDAITASTITSRAFLLAVNNAYSAYKATPVDVETGATSQVKSDYSEK